MGIFAVIVASLLAAIWLSLFNLGQGTPDLSPVPGRPAIQSVAANLIEFHQAAVNFVTLSVNKSPASTKWEFTYKSQAAVRCSPYSGGAYPVNSSSGTCTPTDTSFQMPTFMSTALPMYDWVVCYKTGSPNIVVTYSRAGASPGGYSPTEIQAALADYNISTNYSNWYWGVTATGPTLANPSSISLPTACTSTEAVGVGVIALATIIP